MKRKYAKSGEKFVKQECTIRKCKWNGTDDEKDIQRVDSISSELVCPKCGNNEFYGLLD